MYTHIPEDKKNKSSQTTHKSNPFAPRPFAVQRKPENTISQPVSKKQLYSQLIQRQESIRQELYAQYLQRKESDEARSSNTSFAPHEPWIKEPVQAKLTIGQANDKYEQEADKVAADVVQRINAPGSEKGIIEHQEESLNQQLQSKPAITSIQRDSIAGGSTPTTEFESQLSSARGSGKSLEPNLQSKMEGAFGADFSGVKVHTDSKSDQLNNSIQAKAFTTGQDIFFRGGEYNPGSRSGQELVAHELTHVVQQNGSDVVQSKFLSAPSNLIQRDLSQADKLKYRDEYNKRVIANSDDGQAYLQLLILQNNLHKEDIKAIVRGSSNLLLEDDDKEFDQLGPYVDQIFSKIEVIQPSQEHENITDLFQFDQQIDNQQVKTRLDHVQASLQKIFIERLSNESEPNDGEVIQSVKKKVELLKDALISRGLLNGGKISPELAKLCNNNRITLPSQTEIEETEQGELPSLEWRGTYIPQGDAGLAGGLQVAGRHHSYLLYTEEQKQEMIRVGGNPLTASEPLEFAYNNSTVVEWWDPTPDKKLLETGERATFYWEAIKNVRGALNSQRLAYKTFSTNCNWGAHFLLKKAGAPIPEQIKTSLFPNPLASSYPGWEKMNEDGLYEGRFTASNLAKFKESNLLQGIDLAGNPNLRNADLSDADLRNANLRNANLSNANLSNANLSNANLDGANLSDANLRNANLTNASLQACTRIDRAILIQANITGANFQWTEMHGTNLSFAILKGAILDDVQADSPAIKFNGADLTNASLSGNFKQADFRFATLTNTNLNGANLRLANFRGVDLTSANIIGADLTNADLRSDTLNNLPTNTRTRH